MLTSRDILSKCKPYAPSKLVDCTSIKYNGCWWSNGFVLYVEQMPDKIKAAAAKIQREMIEINPLNYDPYKSLVGVSDLEVSPLDMWQGMMYDDKSIVVRFAPEPIEDAFETFYDARYVASLIKRGAISWKNQDRELSALVAYNDAGAVVGLLMPICVTRTTDAIKVELT